MGEGANGEPISIVNGELLLEPWRISSEGWEQCGDDVVGAYTRDLEVTAVRTDMLAQ